MKMLITTVLTTVFLISMAAFILSFNACLSAQEPAIIHGEKIMSMPVGTLSNFIKDEQKDTITPVFDKAELIVFNSDGEVIYNEIIPSI